MSAAENNYFKSLFDEKNKNINFSVNSISIANEENYKRRTF